MHSSIHAVGFDFGGTLATSELSEDLRIQNTLRSLGLKTSQKVYNQILYEINECYGKGDPRSLTEESDWLDKTTMRTIKLLKAKNTRYVFTTFKNCIALLKLKFHVFFDVEDTLKALKRKKIKTYVIVNNWPSLNQVLVKTGLKKYFDTVVISSKVGYEKLAREIFEIATRRLNVKPGQMVHVGNEECDVVGARNAGVIPVLIDRGILGSNLYILHQY